MKAGVGVEVVEIYEQAGDTVEDDQGVRVWRLAGAQVPYTRFVRNSSVVSEPLRKLRKHAGWEGEEARAGGCGFRGTC